MEPVVAAVVPAAGFAALPFAALLLVARCAPFCDAVRKIGS